MNVVVSSGSYKCDYMKEFSRAVVVDQDNNIYLENYEGYYLFPGFLNTKDKRNEIEPYIDNIFGSHTDISYYGRFNYYYLSRYWNISGKRLFNNDLDITNLYIVRINSNDITKELDDSIVKIDFSKLQEHVLNTKYDRYRDEMLVILKLLPDSIKGRENFKIKRLKKEG